MSNPKEIEIEKQTCKRYSNERNRKTKNIIRKTRRSGTFKRSNKRKTRKIRYRKIQKIENREYQ